jgi:uncharacterized Zn finger protein
VSVWTQRWRAVLDDPSPQVRRRLRQGAAYQRSGRVTDVRIGTGSLTGRVQGSRPTPYLVEVAVGVLSDQAWAEATAQMGAQVRYRAALLAGRSPDGLDADLEAAGVRLFPDPADLDGRCGCADSVSPCAHVAALWEAAAELIAVDPFVLLRLRGRGPRRLLAELAAVQASAGGSAAGEIELDALPGEGWTRARAPLDLVELPAMRAPRTPVPALRLRGDPPGWAGGVAAEVLFAPLVEHAARTAAELEP